MKALGDFADLVGGVDEGLYDQGIELSPGTLPDDVHGLIKGEGLLVAAA